MDFELLWKPTGALVSPSLRLDLPGAVMLVLVLFIAAVIARYSATCLQGEPPARMRRYWRALAATVACVLVIAVANNLAVVAAAWVGTSLSMHVLLTHFQDRWQALVAAHKKFIASRIAEAALVAGLALLAASTGTLELDALAAHARTHGLDAAGQAGMALVAFAALLKCAQLPVHGWLIQVMEAPTPVSALLHAGVINLAGFVLVRLAEPLAQAPVAQGLLVVVGASTAAIASLVATTRVSIKVALAWSTCAQMGFMLVECGLGAPGLALLHLVAHSLYKAHAFLAAGEVVAGAAGRVERPVRAVSLGHALLAAAGGLVLVFAAAALLNAQAGDPATWALGAIAGLALAPWLLPGAPAPWFARVLIAGGLALLYAGLHRVLPQAAPADGAAWPAMAALVLFAALFLVQSMLRAAPHAGWARRVQPWFFGGLFLDDLFTRITFRLWPLRATRVQETPA